MLYSSIQIKQLDFSLRGSSYSCNLILTFLFIYSSNANTSPECNGEEISAAFLDLAVHIIAKAKTALPVCSPVNMNSTRRVDCEELLSDGQKRSGIYTIWPRNRIFEDKPLDVYCDMETDGGGWLVIQRRGNFSRPEDYFFKDWDNYKKGFGDLDKDFWLGNDKIFGLTNQRLYSIRFDLKDVEGNTAYALFDTFWIDDENHTYTLHIKDYSGNAGDSMISHDNQVFSTKDKDNDAIEEVNCAQVYKGGWWYNNCHGANLNGLYLYGKHESYADGVEWESWKGYHESLAATEMKIRPKNSKKHLPSLKTPKT